jgi:hypothetical protein
VRSSCLLPFRAALGALLALALPSLLAAATYTVSGTRGSDQTGNGSALAPWKSVTYAVGRMASGDTLEIEGIPGGSYNDYLCNVPSGESWERPTVVRGLPGPPVVLMPLVDVSSVVAFAGTATCPGGNSYVVLDHLVLDATYVSGSAVSIKDGSHHIRISNSEVRNAFVDNCILISHGHSGEIYSDYNEFLNLDVHDCGLLAPADRRPHGIYMATSHNRIEDSRFHDTRGYGVHLYNQLYLEAACTPGGPAICCNPADPHRCDVSYNVVRNTEAYRSRLRDGILVSCGTGNLVHGTRTHDNALNGLRVDFLARGTSLYDNISWNNGGRGITVGYISVYSVFDTALYGNIAYHTEGAQMDIAVAPTAVGTVQGFNYPQP